MGKYQVKVVNCYKLNIRVGAGTRYTIRAVVLKNQTYTSSKQSGNWYYIDEKKGWADKQYLKVVKDLTPKPVKTTPPKSPAKNPAPVANYGSIKEQIAGPAYAPPNNFIKLVDNNRNSKAVADTIPLKDIAPTPMSYVKDESDGVLITDYTIDVGFIKDNYAAVKENLNIIGDRGYRNIRSAMFDRFNRFKIAFPDYHLTNTHSHVFFTRPDLNVLVTDASALNWQTENDPFFYYMWNNNPKLVKSLTQTLTWRHDFHPFLSNSAASFEVSDEVIKTREYGQTYTGYKVQYGKSNVESNSSGTFSVTYQDDREATIYKTHKMWTEYISRVHRGALRPREYYFAKKVLDYTSSVYYFVCGPDGETILFWTKYFGAFPINTPASAMSWAKGSSMRMPQFSINYAYAFKEDFNPLAIAEFNENSEEDFVYKKTYDHTLAGSTRSISGAPFIESSKNADGQYIYKLRYRL